MCCPKSAIIALRTLREAMNAAAYFLLYYTDFDGITGAWLPFGGFGMVEEWSHLYQE